MAIQNPLQQLLNIADAAESDDYDDYAMIEQQPTPPAVPTEPAPDVKDADDIDVEKKIDTIYDAAIAAFNEQTAYMEVIEPRYAARNAEVAANYLSIALQAANSKAKNKNDRKRSNAQFIPYSNGGKTTNNLIVANREDILKMINVDGKDREN